MDEDFPPSGIPSPPNSCPPSPSSFASDFPSNLSGSVFSLLSHTPGSPQSLFRGHLNTTGFTSHDHPESSRNLVIPSLALPGNQLQPESQEAASRRHAASQTLGGDSVGKLNVLVVGRVGSGKTDFCEALVAGSEAVIKVSGWEDDIQGRVLNASTIAADHHENNVRIVRVPGWNDNDDAEPILASLRHTIHAPFYELDHLLDPKQQSPSASLRALLSSTATPLYVAAVFLHSSPPTPLESHLLSALSSVIPVIPLASHHLYQHPLVRSRRSSRPPFSHDYITDSRIHSPTSSRFNSRPQSPHISRGSSLSRSISPYIRSPLPDALYHPESLRELQAILFRGSSLQRLRQEASDKFLAWRQMERLVESFVQPPSPVLRPQKSILGDDDLAFERFTFDLILGAAGEDSDEEQHVEEHDPPRGRPTSRRSLDRSKNIVAQAELDLSQTVAMRKRAPFQHRDTNATIRRHSNTPPEEAYSVPLAVVDHPLEDMFGSVRDRSDTIRPVRGPDRPLVRVPLSALPIPEDALFPPSRSESVSNSAYASALSSRSASRTPSSGTPPSVSVSQMQQLESETDDEDERSHFGLYHGRRTRKAERDDMTISTRDPLHLPSLFSLAISLVPQVKRRLLKKVHPLMFLRRTFGIGSVAVEGDCDASLTSPAGSSTSTSTWTRSVGLGGGGSGGPGFGPTFMFGLACFCAGLGWGVVFASQWSKRAGRV